MIIMVCFSKQNHLMQSAFITVIIIKKRLLMRYNNNLNEAILPSLGLVCGRSIPEEQMIRAWARAMGQARARMGPGQG